MAGIIKHGFHPGESSFESLPIWARIFYPLGLGLVAFVLVMLGIWGWDGVTTTGRWWAGLPGILLAIGIAWKVMQSNTRTQQSSPRSTNWLNLFRMDWFYRMLWSLYRFLGRISNTLAAQLEGDSGILWSLVILVLLISLIIQLG